MEFARVENVQCAAKAQKASESQSICIASDTRILRTPTSWIFGERLHLRANIDVALNAREPQGESCHFLASGKMHFHDIWCKLTSPKTGRPWLHSLQGQTQHPNGGIVVGIMIWFIFCNPSR